ncbi:LLM class flavin-dependent oxidoreductase [Amycolatopsis taiwanensis]|uniref:LLM class flavin-dependent oxidoreductase n=1 Tax=Amycolatopsis taiwanensis TaxID=342230 RepID=UPI0004891BE4|nr:LLM class flavin-dependent oxidoreductase [Amycolatopsis taiwanensis]
MSYGLLLPSGQAQLQAGGSASGLVDVAVRAERLGFDSVWAGDSMVRARIEPLTLLTAIAQATERLTVGTALLMPYRHPVHTALVLSSIDQLSRGRLVVGVGAGFPGFSEQELAVAGVPFRRRFSYVDDTVTLWRELWSGQPESFHGKVLHYDWLPEVPRPDRPGGPPIWLGGITPSALERTGRLYDGWLPYPPDPADYATALARIREVAGDRPVKPALFATVHLDDDIARGRAALDEYCAATYRMPLDQVEQIQVMMTGPDVADQIGRFLDAGAQDVLIRIGALEPAGFEKQLTGVAELLSHLRRRV